MHRIHEVGIHTLRLQRIMALALLGGLLLTGLAPRSAAAQDAVRIVVAVLPFEVHSAEPLDYLENSLADLLATRLEASERVEVVEALTVRETLVAYPGERTEAVVRRLAREVGADFVVLGSLTELAGHYSLDVRVTPVDSLVATSTMVFTAENDDALLDRINELASRVLSIVGEGTFRARVVAVEVTGVQDLPEETTSRLRMQPGAAYDSAAVRDDLSTLRGMPGIASASVQTERGREGVRVVYRLVPTERILPLGDIQEVGDPIAEVRIEGNKRIEAGAIRARITTRAGDPYDARRISEDVREIHGLGFFRNVRVLSDEGVDGRVITFEVEENPVIRQVSITGNDSVDGEKIRDNLTLTTGSTLDIPLLFENRERIEALYRAEGYYLAQVRYEIEETGPDAVAVNFEVSENDKLTLTKISFDGNEEFTDDELNLRLKTKSWRWYSYVTKYLDRSGTYSEPVFMQDLQTLQSKYLDAGYIQVEISDPEVTPVEDGLEVVVEIKEGRRFNTGTVDVAGDDSVDIDALRDRLSLKVGEPFSRSFLNSDLKSLEDFYTNRGFYQAEVAPLTRVNETDEVVDVTFEVVKGPLYFIREIDITGNTTTVDTVIRREVPTVEGELYSVRRMRLANRRIRGLGYFEDISLDAKLTDFEDQLDLEVRVIERPTGSLSFGAGFSSLDKFVVSGSVSQSNLFGRGYGLALSADIGGTSTRFFLSFTDPYFMGSTFGFAASLSRTDLEFTDFEQEQTGIDFTLSHFLDEAHTTRGSVRYSYSARDITERGGFNAAGVIFRELLGGTESTSLVGLTLQRDTRNDRISPTSGSAWGVSADIAGLGGFAKYIRLEGRSTWFRKTPDWMPSWFPFRDESAWVLGIRGGWVVPFNEIGDFTFDTADFDTASDSEVQALQNIDTDVKLPLTERYFLGGIGTFQLRGYKARSVGPRRAVLKRGGLFGTGDAFTPVGRSIIPTATGLDSVCTDFDNSFVSEQGDGDEKCNSIFDTDIDDFDDLDETDVIGGNKFLSATIEYRFPISESLGLVGILFLDMGNAFDETQSFIDLADWRFGTGFGVQWFSPFGPLQAFVGFPINKLEVEDGQVFEFSVGGATF
ncbi:MAG: outer membrane protein assembly factor BamA [Deltaproteobacteria bacterium]|nr:outer membrane protein assembly factor BamA [Deltaproteobacteria bacterium]